MENPKIMIQSDGRITELYINGEKVEKAIMADFRFYAEPFYTTLDYKKYQTDESGKAKVENNEFLIESFHLENGGDS